MSRFLHPKVTGQKAPLSERLNKIRPIQCLVKVHNRLVEFASSVENVCRVPILSKNNIKKLSNQEISDLHDSDLQSAIKTFNREGDNIFNSSLTAISDTLNRNRFEIKYILQPEEKPEETSEKPATTKLTRVKTLAPKPEPKKPTREPSRGASEPTVSTLAKMQQKSKRVPHIRQKKPLRTQPKPQEPFGSYSHQHMFQEEGERSVPSRTSRNSGNQEQQDLDGVVITSDQPDVGVRTTPTKNKPLEDIASHETLLSIPDSDTKSIKIVASKISEELKLADKQSVAQLAKDWMDYLTGTDEAEQIFKNLEKITLLEERRDYYYHSFDVSKVIFQNFFLLSKIEYVPYSNWSSSTLAVFAALILVNVQIVP